jgi:hypothetical protein
MSQVRKIAIAVTLVSSLAAACSQASSPSGTADESALSMDETHINAQMFTPPNFGNGYISSAIVFCQTMTVVNPCGANIQVGNPGIAPNPAPNPFYGPGVPNGTVDLTGHVGNMACAAQSPPATGVSLAGGGGNGQQCTCTVQCADGGTDGGTDAARDAAQQQQTMTMPSGG